MVNFNALVWYCWELVPFPHSVYRSSTNIRIFTGVFLYAISKQINAFIQQYTIAVWQHVLCCVVLCCENAMRYHFIVHWFIFSQYNLFLINRCWLYINYCLVFKRNICLCIRFIKCILFFSRTRIHFHTYKTNFLCLIS